jgi:transposase
VLVVVRPGLVSAVRLAQEGRDVLAVEDWAEIRRLHLAEDLAIKEVARRLGVARNTVRQAVRSAEPPRFHRRPRPSAVDAYEPAIRQLLGEHPRMPATVIAQRIGWPGGITVLKQRVATLRPLYVPPDPCQRTDYQPGELAQWDLWFPPVDIPLGWGQTGRLPVLVGVSGYSRWLVARMLPSRQAHDLLLGHLACLVALGGLPRAGVYDNEAAIGRWHGGRVQLTEAFQRFRGTLGMGTIVCKPRDPEAKGLVERANRYLATSFLPGRAFTGVTDFNLQLTVWLELANRRRHRTLGCRPADRIAEDRAAMRRLPPLLPDPALRCSALVHRDHYLRIGSCDYSVHPRAIGRRVEVRVDLDWVTATMDGMEVARHRRSLAAHRTITDPAHVRARQALRTRHRAQAARPAAPAQLEVAERDLAVYDRLFDLEQLDANVEVG